MNRPAIDNGTPSVLARWFPSHLSFRTLTVLLVAISTLPLVAFNAFVLVRFVDEQTVAAERRLLQLARSQSILVEREFGASVRALMAMAESEHLGRDDLAAFEQEARRVLPTQPSWQALFVVSPDGQVVVDTSKAPAEPLGPVIERGSFEQLVRTRKPLVGHLRRGPDGRFAFPVRVPVLRDGTFRYGLTALVTPESLGEVIARQWRPGEEWTRSIIDAAGVIAARTRAPERFIGQPATPEALARIAQSPEGVFRSQSREGEMVYAAYSRGLEYGWTSSVAVAAEHFDQPVRQTTMALVTFSGAAITLTALGAWLLAGRITQRLRETAAAADTLARGARPEIPPSIVTEVAALGAALERSSALLAQRQQERDDNLRRAEDALGAAEQARTSAEAARAEAESAARAKDEFLAMLGHELRNPLSPIVTALHLIQLRKQGWDREHAVIARQVQHLTRLVDDLLDVSRITRGKIDLKREIVNIRAVVEQAIEMSSPLLEEREHRLSVDVPESGCLVAGDRSRLAQVVGNLLTNAARYTPPGGKIHVHAQHEAGTVSISVSDSGQGLSADLLPRVFDLFVQGPRTAGREEGGLGLGLTIVQQLVRLHGGTVDVASEGEGRGSTFTIRLPPADVAAHQPAIADQPPAPALVSMRVLVVDDNRDAAETLASVLQARGHKVVTAYDAPGAIDVAASFGPAVAILDIGLPVMDGYELAERLRDRLGHGAPVFIAVTGYGQEHDRARSRRAGFAAHFVKPVDVDHLARQLADLAAPATSAM